MVYYQLKEYGSAQQLLQVLKEDDFASQYIVPEQGIEKSSFSEAINKRGLEQLLHFLPASNSKRQTCCPMRTRNSAHWSGSTDL